MKRTEVIIFGINGSLGSAIAGRANSDFAVAAGVSGSAGAATPASASAAKSFPVYAPNTISPEFANGRTVIDASSPAGTVEALALSVKARSRLIVATTGHDVRQLNEISEAANKIPIVMDSNFSRGIGMLRNLLPVLFPAPPGFDVSILDRHRAMKKDAPSGTARQLADSISSICGGMRLKTEAGPRAGREIEVVSIRAGTASGSEHRIFLHSAFEELELRHTVTDSRAYADGITDAVKWLNDRERKPGIYSMSDILGDRTPATKVN